MAIQNLMILQRASFNEEFIIAFPNGSRENLTGWTVRAFMKRSVAARSYIDLNAEIAGDPQQGVITLSLTPEQTANLTPRRYLYDLVGVTADGEVKRIAEGIVTVVAGITPSVAPAEPDCEDCE